jgi:biopolymer transport protein ExbD
MGTLRQDFTSTIKMKNFILTFMCLIWIGLAASTASAQVLGDVDQRSLKNKIDPSNTSPIIITIENDGEFSFQSHLYTLSQIKGPLDEVMDNRLPGSRVTTIQANSDSPFSKLVDLMKLGRDLQLDDFALKDSESSVSSATKFKIVLDQPAGKEPRPGGMFLRVEISNSGSLSFNGSPSTKEAISARLKIIFADRTRRKLYVIGSKDIEKSVFIKPSLSTKLSDVLGTIELLKNAGAVPIGVQIDWLNR